jgi:hypothetical protein
MRCATVRAPSWRGIVGGVERAAAEGWIRSHIDPAGEIETEREAPWATVLRVPIAEGDVAWFKACAPAQSFEPRLTVELFSRWPDRVAEVLGYDEQRGWLLLADAGVPIGAFGDPPEAWLDVLPLYAELQRGEAEYAPLHVAHGVPDLRLDVLPQRYEDLLRADLPLDRDELVELRAFAPRFGALCDELSSHAIPETVQHDDLRAANVYVCGERLRVLDWGDASISHPFASLLATFRFLEEEAKLPQGDQWSARLRDAYLEPWGPGLEPTFDLAMRVAAFAHPCAWARQRDRLGAEDRAKFDPWFTIVLRRAVARIAG